MNVLRLDDCCEILDSMRVPITAKDRKTGPYPYYGANGIQDYVADYIFDDELVLLAEDGGNFGSKEKTIAYRVSGKCWVNNHAHVLKPKPGVDVDYLCYSLMFYNTDGLVTGATRQKLTQIMMRKMQIPKRSIDEQRIIVNQLNKVLSIQKLYQKELSLLDVIVKARFIEFFGDPVKNIYNYPEHMLGDIVEFLTSGSRGWAKYYSKKGKMFITIKNVKDGQISTNNIQYITPPDNAEARRTKVQNGDLLISITADLGRTAVVPKEIAEKGAYINQHLMCVRLNKKVLLPEYVSFFMESEAGKRQFYAKNQNAVKAGLNFDAIKTFKIMVPPLEKQNEYIYFTKCVNKSKVAINRCTVIIGKALQSGYHYVWGN